MRRRIIAVVFSVLVSGSFLFGQNSDTLYKIGTWGNFADGAITYTFDDGCANQFTKAIPMFNQFKYGGTFFTVTGWGPNWSGLRAAYSNGHEVASHTVTHANYSSLDTTQQFNESKNAAESIYNQIPGMKSMTFAYPYCAQGVDSIQELFYFASRGCSGAIEPATPANFSNISSIVCGSEGEIESSDDFNERADATAAAKGWNVYLIHGIDGDGGYSDLSSIVLRQSLEYLKSNPEKFWVGTFGNVARYIRERNCATVHELDSDNDTTLYVEVTDTLPDSVYYQPITIRRPRPDNWLYVTGTQGQDTIPAKVVEVDGQFYIQFDAIPDSAVVILKNCLSEPVAIDVVNDDEALNVWIDEEYIYFRLPASSELKHVGLYSLTGILITKDYTLNDNLGLINRRNVSVKPGVYLLSVNDGKRVLNSKIQLL